MNVKTIFLALSIIAMPAVSGLCQTETIPEPPTFKPYKGKPGKIVKYNNFNYLDIRDDEGKNNRQAMGPYWEISYTYDSVFRQKRKFRDFMISQIVEMNGSLFFQDTMQIHFVIPSKDGNVWGRVMLSSDKLYRLRLIRESAFVNQVQFDTRPLAVFEKYVDSIELPPHINYLPHSLITRSLYSKYDHQEFSWNVMDTLFHQKVMGPFWELKLEVHNSLNDVDKHVSSVEILESYYRACIKAGGTVLRSRPRELVFTMRMNDATLWSRVSVSLDGVYFVRVMIEADKDRSEPEKVVTATQPTTDAGEGSDR